MIKIIVLLIFINYIILILGEKHNIGDLCKSGFKCGIATEYGINEDNGKDETPDLNAGYCANNDKRIELYDPIVAVGKDILNKYGCGTEIEIFNNYKLKQKNYNGYKNSIKVIIYDECPECNNKNGERIDLPAYNWNKLYSKIVYIKDKKPNNDLGELPIVWNVTGKKINVKNTDDLKKYLDNNKVERKWWN